MDLIKELKKVNCGRIIENIDLRKYTTYKTGGIGKVLVIPKDLKELQNLVTYIKKNNLKYKILGNGSNLIFGDQGYDGILIKLEEFDNLAISGNMMTVGAGYSLMKLAQKAANADLTGLEFAAGIPGTVGGAVYMNAGAYKSDMGYIVNRIRVLTPDLEIKTMYNKELDFHYRTSFLKNNPGYICLEATLFLRYGKKAAILEVMNDRKKRRLESQPLEYPSAGSVFRNPEGDFAGRLIEEIGYKGFSIGDAMVSEKHANFIINKGHASGDDIKKLILEIQKKVKEEYGIELILEQEIVE